MKKFRNGVTDKIDYLGFFEYPLVSGDQNIVVSDSGVPSALPSSSTATLGEWTNGVASLLLMVNVSYEWVPIKSLSGGHGELTMQYGNARAITVENANSWAAEVGASISGGIETK